MVTVFCSVSRLAKGKKGYQENKKDFGNSFCIEELSIPQLIKTLTIDGYPICAPHDRSMPLSIAESRGVTTFRHTENWIMSGYPIKFILLDDDGNLGDDALEFWLNDPFFTQYGSFIYETASSKPSKRKVRPCFIFSDFHITTTQAFANMVKAFYDHYDGRIDRLTDSIRVFYGAENTNCIHVGKLLPRNVYEDFILQPYLTKVAQETAVVDMERAERFVRGRERTVTVRDSFARAIIKGRLKWLVDHCQSLAQGDSRNSKLYWAGRFVAGGLNSFWAVNHVDLFDYVEDDIVSAFTLNGYAAKYGGEREIRRIYGRGFAVGGSGWELPELDDQWFLYEVGEWVEVAVNGEVLTGKIKERKMPKSFNGVRYPAYQINEKIYPEKMVKLITPPTDLSHVKPPLTSSQKEQVEEVIQHKVTGVVIEAYQQGFADGYKAAGYPYPSEIMELMRFGRDTEKERLVNPIYYGTSLVNVEYIYPNGDREYEVEGDCPVWTVEAVGDPAGNIVTVHPYDAIKLWLAGIKDQQGRLYQIHSFPATRVLPQSIDFADVYLVGSVFAEPDGRLMATWPNVAKVLFPFEIKDMDYSLIKDSFDQQIVR